MGRKKVGRVEYHRPGTWGDVPAQVLRRMFFEAIKRTVPEAIKPEDLAGLEQEAKTGMRAFEHDAIPFDLLPSKTDGQRKFTPEESKAFGVPDGAIFRWSTHPTPQFLTWAPTGEEWESYELRIRRYWKYLTKTFDKRLSEYRAERIAALRDTDPAMPVAVLAPLKSEESLPEHLEYLARFQHGGWSMERIAGHYERDQKLVTREIKALARLLGITLRPTSRGGRRPKRRNP